MMETMADSLTLTINSEVITLKDISPTTTLLRYLQQSQRTGTKEGCGDGDCGACTVAIVGTDPNGNPQYQAMNSCLIPIATLAGKEIITVEGIASDQLHPVQAAMVATGGSQCGYCTPGFIMSLFAAYYEGKVDDIAIEGNLCRCTGYLPIRRAAQQLTQQRLQDEFREKLQQLASSHVDPLSYTTATQKFYQPTQLADVLTLLQTEPEAILLAGGTDLGLEMSHDRQSFLTLISLAAIPELNTILQTDAVVEIGAAVPLNQIKSSLHSVFPSLDEMLHWFAACQIRHRATIGGNLGTASPIGDLPPVLLALDAEVKVASMNGERVIAIADFFTGYRQTALQSGEVIVSVIIPRQTYGKRLSQSYKIGKRGTDDISIVAAAFTIDLDSNNQITHARLAYGGVAATPIRATTVEAMLVGNPWEIATIRSVKPILRETFNPLSDLRASAEYRQTLIANLFEKFFIEHQPQLHHD
jgi:xanthine dehydrogenase small subunit